MEREQAGGRTVKVNRFQKDTGTLRGGEGGEELWIAWMWEAHEKRTGLSRSEINLCTAGVPFVEKNGGKGDGEPEDSQRIFRLGEPKTQEAGASDRECVEIHDEEKWGKERSMGMTKKEGAQVLKTALQSKKVGKPEHQGEKTKGGQVSVS